MTTPADPLAGFERPALRPGLAVVRRDDRHLQVGLDAPLRLVLDDDAASRAVVEALRAGRRPSLDDAGSRAAVAALVASELVVESVVPALAAAQHGQRAVAVAERRGRGRVAVSGSPRLGRHLERVLQGSGARTRGDDPPVLVVVLAEGPVDRDGLDAAARAGRAHLVAEVDARRGRVGPLVDPGRTACVRCVDAHEAERDPGRPLVLAQAARDRGEVPVDPALEAITLGWVARDVLAYLDGREPSTWSATVDVGPDPLPRRTAWRRHPCCGCAWDVDLVAR